MVQRDFDLGTFFGLVPLHQLEQDRLLLREVRIERAERKSRGVRDVADRCLRKALFHDFVARSLDQKIPRASLALLAT
jgi:hypothetical protein